MGTTMNISLPEPLKKFVDQQVREGGYAGTSEYVRELIRRQRDVEELRAKLLEGAASPVEGGFDKAYFDDLRKRVRSRKPLRSKA